MNTIILKVVVNDVEYIGAAQQCSTGSKLYKLTWDGRNKNNPYQSIKHKRLVLRRDLFKPIEIQGVRKALTPAFDD